MGGGPRYHPSEVGEDFGVGCPSTLSRWPGIGTEPGPTPTPTEAMRKPVCMKVYEEAIDRMSKLLGTSSLPTIPERARITKKGG